jgi:hypothetical protein
VSWLLVTADLLLVGASGAAVMGLTRSALAFEELVFASVATGLILGAAIGYALSLVLGLTVLSVLLAPLLLGGLAAVLGRGRILQRWRESWTDVVARWRARELTGLVVIGGIVALLSLIVFRRALFIDDAGNLATGYWMPDWAQHLTTAASFTQSGNLPPQNPILSDEPLYYPFLPDFQSAMLVRLGSSLGFAFGASQGLLCLCVGMLVVTFAARLGARRSVGLLAVFICFLGGGLGFSGAFSDACAHRGYDPAHCTLDYVVSHPFRGEPAADGSTDSGITIAGGTVHDLPGIITNQPRAYDGLLTPDDQLSIPNQKWYTPLLAWWLPQRSLVMGFAGAMVVLTLLHAALIKGVGPWPDLLVGGVVAGLMPLVHVHTLVALLIMGAGMAIWRRQRAWLIALGIAAAVALPRLLTLAGGPKGTAELGNQYPWVEPGWLSASPGFPPGYVAFPNETVPHSFSLTDAGLVVWQTVRLPFNGVWWGFWIANLGVVVPLCLAVTVFGLLSLLPAARQPVVHALGRAGRWVTGPYPPDLLRFAMTTTPIFIVANVVVFQSWDWDNTKLFAYWYLGGALLVAALCVHWWHAFGGVIRRRAAPHLRPLADIGRGVASVVTAMSVLATGVIVMLRFLPWQPACGAPGAEAGHCTAGPVSGPYTLVSAADLQAAQAVDAAVPRQAVFMTPPRFDDPITVITGRPVVAGYHGWLWSYGLDDRQRQADVTAAYAGCGRVGIDDCAAVQTVITRYRVAFVEVDTGGQDPPVDAGWWEAQGLPVVARTPDMVVYDVRRP